MINALCYILFTEIENTLSR